MPLKELHPVELVAIALGPRLAGALVVFATDSITNAYAFNSGSSTSPEGNAKLKHVAEAEREYGFDSVAFWLPREFNVVPDALSKGVLIGMNLSA